MKTQLLFDQEPHALHGTLVRALLKIEADAPAATVRTPLNLSIVLDRSGSMHGPKLHAAREAAAQLVERLAPEDVVSVVAYDNVVETISMPQSGNTTVATTPIRNIHARGSTNLSGGWLKGRDYVAQNVKPASANRVVLLTDGLANVGITDPDQLVGLCATANEHGIKTTTIGFGRDYDEHLLAGMAQAGGGNLHYIEHADQAPAVFAEEIQGLLSLAAQNLTLTILPGDAAQSVAVHHAYPRHDTADGLLLEIGDLYAREPKLVLMEILVDAQAHEQVQLARLVIEAAILRSDGAIEQQEITLDLATSIEDGPVVNTEVRRELLLLEAACVRTEVIELGQRGDFDGAAEKMRAMSRKLLEAGIDDAQFSEEAADLAIMADHMVAHDWTAAEDKYMMQRSYDSSRAMRMKSEAISRARRRRKEEE